jgi:hypothetical protein
MQCPFHSLPAPSLPSNPSVSPSLPSPVCLLPLPTPNNSPNVWLRLLALFLMLFFPSASDASGRISSVNNAASAGILSTALATLVAGPLSRSSSPSGVSSWGTKRLFRRPGRLRLDPMPRRDVGLSMWARSLSATTAVTVEEKGEGDIIGAAKWWECGREEERETRGGVTGRSIGVLVFIGRCICGLCGSCWASVSETALEAIDGTESADIVCDPAPGCVGVAGSSIHGESSPESPACGGSFDAGGWIRARDDGNPVPAIAARGLLIESTKLTRDARDDLLELVEALPLRKV